MPGQWIANCKLERVDRISAASVYILQIGPPRPNQIQSLENLEAEGMVGLYRVAKKEETRSKRDQNQYLASSAFAPSPESLKSLLGSLASLRSR